MADYRKCFALMLMAAVAAGLAAPVAAGARRPPNPAIPHHNVKPWDLYSDTWGAVDALGRRLPDFRQVGLPKPQRTVGIFYFLANHVPHGAIYDHTKELRAHPRHPRYGPVGTSQWWGRPVLGYYQSNDPAVIREHMNLLTDAGVNTLIFDNTNGPTYPDVYRAIFKVMNAMRRVGDATPQTTFFAGHQAWKADFANIYKARLSPNLWFHWRHKPLLLLGPWKVDKLSRAARKFFTVRRSWAWTNSTGWFHNGHNKWPWADNYPQGFGWHGSPKKPEEMPVMVAGWADGTIGRTFMGSPGHGGHEPRLNKYRSTSRTPDGHYFAQECRRALRVKPRFVFITGWNEWTATRFLAGGPMNFAGRTISKGQSFFVDEYNEEFSRDAEPENGKLKDNYYYQMASFIRKYKGVRPLPPVTPHAIKVGGSFRQWKGIHPQFRDAVGDAMHRNHAGWGNKRYVNHTGRNDIVAARVSYDKKNVYFYVRTQKPITPHAGKNWMLLFIDSDNNPKTGWLGYDFVVNRVTGARRTTVERHVGRGYHWKPVAKVVYQVKGARLMLAIPRAVLGIGHLPAEINFKWADNIKQSGSWMDFYLNGDVAPDGRFFYRAKLKPRHLFKTRAFRQKYQRLLRHYHAPLPGARALFQEP